MKSMLGENVMRCGKSLFRNLVCVAWAACLTACGGSEIPTPPPLVLPPPEVLPPSAPPQPPLTLLNIGRNWVFRVYHDPGLGFEDWYPRREGELAPPGILDKLVDFGLAPYSLPYETGNSNAHLYSNSTGSTYWLYSRAAKAQLSNDWTTGADATLDMMLHYRKNTSDARLRLRITKLQLEAIDGNPQRPLECLRHPGRHCPKLAAEAFNLLLASHTIGGQDFFRHVLDTNMHGILMDWKVNAYSDSEAEFDIEYDSDGSGAALHPRVTLRNPLVIEVPLDSVAEKGEFWLRSYTLAGASNKRGGESTASAYFRDPLTTDGVTIETVGLEQLSSDGPLPALPDPEPVRTCSGASDLDAGQIQFTAPEFEAVEGDNSKAMVEVTRVGGTRGALGAVVRTSDLTATAGADYTAVDTYVRFEDGHDGTQVVRVPVRGDETAEADETFQLQLTNLGGCGALGAQTLAEVMIYDDDAPPPDPRHAVGGSVTGLTGSGLQLSLNNAELLTLNSNGAFQFPPLLLAGQNYSVTVRTQPNAPAQMCSVSRGTGVMPDTDVADVAVSCTTPPSAGSLDTTFSGGKVSLGIDYFGATDAALQPDGKIVVVGSLSITRFNADGTLDTSFGGDGEVEHLFASGSADSLLAVAIQADGRIVVAGTAGNFNNGDFALARYKADGTLDAAFGADGKVYTDFAAQDDKAYAITLDASNRILVAGVATWQNGTALNSDFALARYSSDGKLDDTFGIGGKVRTQIAGPVNLAYAMAQQADGKIVLAGRTARTLTSDGEYGVARYNADGTLDVTFDADGATSLAIGRGRLEEAHAVSVQGDGKIVVTGQSGTIGQYYSFTTARLKTDGSPDESFGNAGMVATDFSMEDQSPEAVIVQSDGKIIVAGSTAIGSTSDFGLVRYLVDGALDTSFGAGGRLAIDFNGGFDRATSLLVQPDGKIIAAGFARSGSVSHAALIRVNP